MRDGMPVVALVVAGVAVIVALAGFVSRDPADLPEPPAQALDRATRRLESMERERQSMRGEMAKLRAELTRAAEIGPAGNAQKSDMAEVESLVRSVVEAEMTKRLRQRAAEVAAPAPRPTIEQKFDTMIVALQEGVKIDGNKVPAVKAVLSRLREKLNVVYRTYRGKEREAQRNAQANLARRQVDAELAKVLSPAEFARFDSWRKKTTDGYAKRFFAR